jgi:hypothetical protein
MTPTKQVDCYEAAIQSEAKPKRKGSSEADCIQSKKGCYEAAIPSEAEPTLQEEKEQVEEKKMEREKEKER